MTPDKPAVVAPDTTLTYGELVRRSSALARHLNAIGVRAGVPVCLCLPLSAGLVVGALAVLDAGGAYVAVDPKSPERQRRYLLANSTAHVLVTSRQTGMETDNYTVIHVEDVGEQPARLPHGSLHQLAYIAYTFGSGRLPMGVMGEHGILRHLADWHGRTFGLSASDRMSLAAGAVEDGCLWRIWSGLAVGATLYLPADDQLADAVTVHDWWLGAGITIGVASAAMAQALASVAWPHRSALRAVLTGGDTQPRLGAPGPPFAVVHTYGTAEAAVVSSRRITPGEHGASLGHAIDGVEVYLVDHDLRPVPDGAAGEMLVGGATLARGYLHDPVQTRLRFIGNHLSGVASARLLRTGQIAARRPDGALEPLDRKEYPAGESAGGLELDEITTTVVQHPAVRSGCVLTSTHGLIAYLVPANEPVGTAEVDEFLRQFLPDRLLPRHYRWLDALPFTQDGKVDVAALRALGPPAAAAAASRSPATPTEARLADALATMLGRESVDVGEDLFLVGGHSLLAAQLAVRSGQLFDVELPLAAVFANPTIAGLARVVESLSAGAR